METPQDAENPRRALAALSPSAKGSDPTDHWCHNPSRLVLPLVHGAGKAFLAAASVASSACSMPKWVNRGRFSPKEAEGHSAEL